MGVREYPFTLLFSFTTCTVRSDTMPTCLISFRTIETCGLWRPNVSAIPRCVMSAGNEYSLSLPLHRKRWRSIFSLAENSLGGVM